MDVEGRTKITSTSRSYFKNEALAPLSIILSEIVRNILVHEDCTKIAFPSQSCSEDGALVLFVVLLKIVKNNLILREDRSRIASHIRIFPIEDLEIFRSIRITKRSCRTADTKNEALVLLLKLVENTLSHKNVLVTVT